MPKTISASKAKNQFVSILGWVADTQDAVIIESHGAPKAVIIAYSEYKMLQALKAQARRQEAWAQLEQLRQKVRSANPDITSDDQAMAIADEFTRAAVDNLVQKGAIKFK